MAKRGGGTSKGAGSAAAGDLVSIGDLADATGIGPDTIRAWERRYGRPEAVRLPSGHRRYTPADVRWLRRIAEALANGYRPSKVVHLTEKALDELLQANHVAPREAQAVSRWIGMLRDQKTAELRRDLLRDAKKLGADVFVRERLAPLICAVGRAWADGEIQVHHEHALTEIVEDLLRGMRDALPLPRRGPLLLLATLPGEQHGLGLQMVALLARVAGVRCHNLGPDVPIDDILRATDEVGADALGLSVSLATGGVHTDRVLVELRRTLPDRVRILVGGAGARGIRRGPRGIEYAESLDDLSTWLEEFARAGRPRGKGAAP